MLRKLLLQEICVSDLLRSDLQKLFIVFAQHDNIQIVIPRDESLVPYRSERGPGKKLILDVISFAYFIQLFQYFQLDQLQLTELGISPFLLFFVCLCF